MEIVSLVVSIIGVVIALIIGFSQIYFAKRMKDFEIRQDKRDELRRQNYIYAKAIQFIQKYNKNNHESDILLLPLCVAAYKYNPIFSYRREIYRDFCSLTEEIQNEVLKQQRINLRSSKYVDYYTDIVAKIRHNNKICYPNDSDNRLFHENAKYLYKAIEYYNNKPIPDDIRCNIDADEAESCKSRIIRCLRNKTQDMALDKHISNLLAYHKDETPLSDLIPYFQNSDEIVACYICCEIAKYTAIYNCKDPEENEDIETNLGYADDYSGQLYMEDLFLDVLHTVENYNIQKGTN